MPVRLSIAGSTDSYRLAPSKIIAIGLNYQEHISESPSLKVQGLSQDLPSEPILFTKTPNVLIPTDEEIRLPRILAEYNWGDEERTDYEAELAVIISRRCRNASEEEALDFVYGYTCMNDVSQRNIQNADRSGWFRGKSFDTFGPIGPRIVLAKDLGDPQNLNISARLNGKTVQESNTKFMVFPVATLISFISSQITLEEGDLITTGTPSGVGPIRHGDRIEIEIEKIGILSNTVSDDRLVEIS